jgi:hypothetical protein
MLQSFLLDLRLIERFIRFFNMLGLLKRPFMDSLNRHDLLCKICISILERRH